MMPARWPRSTAPSTPSNLSGPRLHTIRQKFDASLSAAQEKLEALKPLLQQATFHLTGNSHIDAAWLWPWTETVDVVKRTFGTALQLMYEYPDYTYTQSAAAYNEWMAEKYPDMNAEIAQRIKEGRWEIVGGMWVEPDLNMPDGESLVRQLLVGKRWYKQALRRRCAHRLESRFLRLHLAAAANLQEVRRRLFRHPEDDLERHQPASLQALLVGVARWLEGSHLFPARLRATTISTRCAWPTIWPLPATAPPGMTEMMDLYGIGDHGGGPTRAILDEGFHWAARRRRRDHVMPKYRFGTAQPYFSTVEKEIAPDSPDWNYQSIAKGYTPPPAGPRQSRHPHLEERALLRIPPRRHDHAGQSQTQHARELERKCSTPKSGPLSRGSTAKNIPADELTEDWKKVLFNQFHDLAAGSGIGVIYKDAQKDYDVVRWSTNEISCERAASGARAD